MIRTYTIADHLREGYRVSGWCEQHGFRDIDLRRLIELGHGDRDFVDDFPKVKCAVCGGRLSIRRTPPSDGPGWY